MSYTLPIIQSERDQSVTDATVLMQVMETLKQEGYCLLRNFDVDMNQFSALIAELCDTVTFDPAREYSSGVTQKVDAGTAAIGLHIENGNTPKAPDLVGFYSRKSARKGSRTTVCDGVQLLKMMPDSMKTPFEQPLKVSRRLSEALWKGYLVNEHPLIDHVEQATEAHLFEMIAAIPGQKAELQEKCTIYNRFPFSVWNVSPALVASA